MSLTLQSDKQRFEQWCIETATKSKMLAAINNWKSKRKILLKRAKEKYRDEEMNDEERKKERKKRIRQDERKKLKIQKR